MKVEFRRVKDTDQFARFEAYSTKTNKPKSFCIYIPTDMVEDVTSFVSYIHSYKEKQPLVTRKPNARVTKGRTRVKA